MNKIIYIPQIHFESPTVNSSLMAFSVEQSKNEMQLAQGSQEAGLVWSNTDRLTKTESSVLTHSAKTSFLEWVTFSVEP